MVNPNIILKKITFIRDHVERVRSQQKCTIEEFLSDRNRQDLVREKVLTLEQGETYRQMLGFRNRLVHEYAETNFTEVYEIMTTQLDDLDRFIEAISNYCHL